MRRAGFFNSRNRFSLEENRGLVTKSWDKIWCFFEAGFCKSGLESGGQGANLLEPFVFYRGRVQHRRRRFGRRNHPEAEFCKTRLESGGQGGPNFMLLRSGIFPNTTRIRRSRHNFARRRLDSEMASSGQHRRRRFGQRNPPREHFQIDFQTVIDRRRTENQ